MKGFCHVCLASDIEIISKDSLSLCVQCLKRISELEKN